MHRKTAKDHMMHNMRCATQQNPEKLRFFRRQLSHFQCIHTFVWHHRQPITDILWTQLFNCFFFCNSTGTWSQITMETLSPTEKNIMSSLPFLLVIPLLLWSTVFFCLHSGKGFCGLVEFNQINYHIFLHQVRA